MYVVVDQTNKSPETLNFPQTAAVKLCSRFLFDISELKRTHMGRSNVWEGHLL